MSDEEDDTIFSSDDDESSDKKKKDPKESKFKTKTSLTTVTVIEDMDQDDGTFGMPKNNTIAMEKGNKKKSKDGDEDEDEDENEEEGGDKKRQRIGSSSATTAKGAKKIYPAKEKTKKFRKSFKKKLPMFIFIAYLLRVGEKPFLFAMGLFNLTRCFCILNKKLTISFFFPFVLKNRI